MGGHDHRQIPSMGVMDISGFYTLFNVSLSRLTGVLLDQPGASLWLSPDFVFFAFIFANLQLFLKQIFINYGLKSLCDSVVRA